MAKNRPIWGRCYDHKFLRFLATFGDQIGVSLIWRKYFKNHDIGSWAQCYDFVYFAEKGRKFAIFT
jgi:hypothetical protein